MTLVQPKSRSAMGGSFLFDRFGRLPIFTREQISDEQRLMYQTTFEFTQTEVLPYVDELERKTTDRMVRLVKRAGALGLLANDVPEAYGGLGGNKVTSVLLAEAVTQYASWSVTAMAHSGIGTLPIVYFGTPQQKEKYLPKLASAEWLGAYALTEPGSGSDALAARCRAVPSADGRTYRLTGTKQFITNGAWADVYIVFAQVERPSGPAFTAFIVERALPGVSVGPEEHKLGLHGSSTTQLLLEDVPVPAENVLGEIGKGHKIAFNILNVGRWKLGAGAVGGAKLALGEGLRYAAERSQFGKPIASFGAVRKKLARAAAGLFAVESMCYRVAGDIDERTAALSPDDAAHDRKVIDAIEEYAIEASIVKVAGSELVFDVTDAMLQVHGGYGYLEEYAIARSYRDCRINRIFEGTNEVNRMLIPGMILKRVMAGALPLMQAFAEAKAEAAQPSSSDDQPADADLRAVESAKRATVYALGVAVGRWMQALGEEQEVLEALADASIACYGLDSSLARAGQIRDAQGAEAAELPLALARTYAAEARPRLFESLRAVVTHAADGTEREEHLQALARFESAGATHDVFALRDVIAGRLLERGRYEV
jgi:alkylation response protein AidB-like acyl-CoA dehydrogenase